MGRFNQEFMFVYRMYVRIHDAIMHFFGSHIRCKPQSNLIVHVVSSRVTNLIALPNRIQNCDSDIVLLSCFCRACVEQKHDVWTVPKSSYLVQLPDWLLCDIRLYCFCHRFHDWPFEARLCETLVTVPRHALHILHFMHILGRLLVILLIARRSWSSFVQGNDWFCLIDACCFIDRSLIVEQFHAGKRLVLFDWYF